MLQPVLLLLSSEIRLFLLTFLIIVFRWKACDCFEQDLTVSVLPRREECFYQPVTKGQFIDIDYQVIDGGIGQLDINFVLFDPHRNILQNDMKKTDGSHRHEAQETGDYGLCFDNTFSLVSAKIVFFELIVEFEDSEDDNDDDDDDNKSRYGVTAEEVYDLTVEELQDRIHRVKERLIKIRHMQEQFRAFEARDRTLQEQNFSRVNKWSTLQLLVMSVVGLIQVVTLRGLFDDKSRLHRIWKIGQK